MAQRSTAWGEEDKKASVGLGYNRFVSFSVSVGFTITVLPD
jgi:hypothetical protein